MARFANVKAWIAVLLFYGFLWGLYQWLSYFGTAGISDGLLLSLPATWLLLLGILAGLPVNQPNGYVLWSSLIAVGSVISFVVTYIAFSKMSETVKR